MCLLKNRKILILSPFSGLKIGGIFLNFFSVKNIGLGDQLLLVKLFEIYDFQNALFSKYVPNYCWLPE